MNYKTYSSQGFVIKRKKFKEADRIINLFTKDFGKLTVIAKGVRKPTSRKRGGLEIFELIKFSASKSHSLDIITEVEIIDSFEEIRKDLKKVSVAFFFCEVVEKLTREEEKHEAVFNTLKIYFEKLKTSRNLKKLRFEFITEVLVELGFWPHDKKIDNPDAVLEGIIERKINSIRVGKKMLQHY